MSTADAIDRGLAAIKAKRAAVNAKRAARRAAMPTVSAIVAQYAAFNPVVVYASERGITVGTRPVYAEVFDVPQGYHPMARVEVKGRKC